MSSNPSVWAVNIGPFLWRSSYHTHIHTSHVCAWRSTGFRCTASGSGSSRLSEESPSLCHAWSLSECLLLKSTENWDVFLPQHNSLSVNHHNCSLYDVTPMGCGINIGIIVCGSIWPGYIIVKGSCTDLKYIYFYVFYVSFSTLFENNL